MSEVVVVTGIGGMGIACARRLGPGRELVVTDFDEEKLERETAEDIASAVEWLASPVASFVTGCDLRVDGGVTAAIHGLMG
jgi:NAD(P)-dependent dehydrogenase (short-subunit alcohol dehydrogenase family)